MHIHGETLALSNAYVDTRTRLDHMDRHGVDRQVLSLPGLFGIDSLGVEESGPLVGLFNDALSALVGQHPARFAGLAALPLADMDSLGVQARLSDAMLTLAMTDFLQPFGAVTVQVANLGGSLPWLLERMDQVAALRDPGGRLPSAQARDRGVFVDCASFGPRAIQMATDMFGIERLLFGTDHPIFETARSLRAIETLPLDEAGRSAILRGNARSVLERRSRANSVERDDA